MNNEYYDPTTGQNVVDMTDMPKKPKKESKGIGKKVLAVVAAAAICFGAGFGGATLALEMNSESSEPGKGQSVQSSADANLDSDTVKKSDRSAVQTSTVKAGEAMTAAQIYQNYSDSVVCITVSTESGEGAGTGFFITEGGYIMTCYHVVDGAEAISVTMNDGETSYAAKYVGGDEDQDIAVIKVDEENVTFHAVTMGDSSLLAVGDTVTAIGNALGELANTTTSGIVSATDRAISMSDGTVMRLLQTDTTINSGNSGGPLFNAYGEVVGVVNAKYSSSTSMFMSSSTASIEGIGFAIPVNDATAIMDDLINYGYVTGKPLLGIAVSTVSSIMEQRYPDKYVVGAYVNSVNAGSCAQASGIQEGDIIVECEGTTITSSAELIDAKNKHKAGEEMTMKIFRNGEYFTITVTLDELVPESDTNSSANGQNNSQNGYSNGQDNGQNGYSNGQNPSFEIPDFGNLPGKTW